MENSAPMPQTPRAFPIGALRLVFRRESGCSDEVPQETLQKNETRRGTGGIGKYFSSGPPGGLTLCARWALAFGSAPERPRAGGRYQRCPERGLVRDPVAVDLRELPLLTHRVANNILSREANLAHNLRIRCSQLFNFYVSLK